MLYNQDQSQTEAVDQQLSPGYKCLPDYLLNGTDLCTVGNGRIQPKVDQQYEKPISYTINGFDEDILKSHKNLVVFTNRGKVTCNGYSTQNGLKVCWKSAKDYQWLIDVVRLAIKEQVKVNLYGATNESGNIARLYFSGLVVIGNNNNIYSLGQRDIDIK